MCYCVLQDTAFPLWKLREWSNDVKCLAKGKTEDTEDSKDFRLLCLLNILIHHLCSVMASYIAWSNFRHLSLKRPTKSSALVVNTGSSLAASKCSKFASLSAGLPAVTQKHDGREFPEYRRLSSLGTLQLKWGSSLLNPAGWRIPESCKLIQIKSFFQQIFRPVGFSSSMDNSVFIKAAIV